MAMFGLPGQGDGTARRREGDRGQRVTDVFVDAQVVRDSPFMVVAIVVAIGDSRDDARGLASREVRGTAVEQGLDALPRREELELAKERQRRHLTLATEPAERLVGLYRTGGGRGIAAVG